METAPQPDPQQLLAPGDEAGSEAQETLSPPAPTAESASADFVRTVIRNRRLRDQFFKSDLFADPAWDMLLDLYAARLEQRDVAVASLCIAAAVPATTALRWLKSLCDQGVFVAVADPEDGRQAFIRMSDASADAMAKYLAATSRSSDVLLG